MAPADPITDNSIKRHDELQSLPIPESLPEEVALVSEFNKRKQSHPGAYPPSPGVPHFVIEGSVKLPAPKSHDKISPLVAPPSRSGRKVAPELGYVLPCEVQGVFSSKYRPALGKGGLDDRRTEAKGLLDDYDRSMRALGKRQPKYTEYPHAFKEQLKADEASKNKAGKKAKKDQDKPIRPATRPTDPVEVAAWDTIGIVNVDASTARTSALIAGRVQQAGEFFVKLRSDMNRSKLEWEQAVKDKLPEDRIAPLKLEADRKKEALYRALDATVEHADDAVLDNLGGHQKLILSLVNTLISCVKANDFSGKLPKIVLELFTHFRMTKKIVETTNFETVRKRFEDKGDDEARELAREIAAKVRKFLKASEPETATGYTGTSAASRAKTAATKPPADGASSKRGREDDSDTRTVKKIAVESGASSLSKKLGQAKAAAPATSRAAPAKPALSSVLPGKSRPIAKTVPKADEVKADSPGATADKSKVDVKNPAAAKPDSKPETKAVHKATAASTTSASSSALSGIASLLDSINSKKTEAAPATAKEPKPVDLHENADQKSKRLRKEARKKLRVSWKPDDELVQIKVFEKDDEEDEGRDTNMIRDAADDRSEGMMLKQRRDVEDEEEDDDIPYQPWMAPMGVDFSPLPTDIREKSYVTRGGSVEFSTDEQKRIADREQRELMAIYTDPDDIPPTPKSPLPETAQTSGDSKSGQLPLEDAKFGEIQHRWRDEQNAGVDQALYAAIGRLEGKDNPSNKLNSILGSLKGASGQASASQSRHAVAHQTFPFAAGPAAEEQVHAWLVSERIRSWRDPSPVHVDLSRQYQYVNGAAQLSGGIIEMVAKALAGRPFPATTPPNWLANDEERIREWWLGYNKEASAKQKKADEHRARAEAQANALRMAAAGQGQGHDWNAYLQQQQQQQQQQPQQDYAPYLALLQQMTGQQVGSGQNQQGQLSNSQLESILASMNQSQPSQGANPLANLNPNDASYQQLLQQLTQGQHGAIPPPPPPPPPSMSEHRSEQHEQHDWDNRGDNSKDGRRKKPTLAPHKPTNKALIGTKPCTFWQQGKCARGDQCTFRHD